MMELLINNIGSVSTIIVFLVGGVAFVQSIRFDVNRLDLRLSKFEKEIEKEMESLRNVILQLARQEGKVAAMEQVVIQQGLRLDRFIQSVLDGKTERF